MVDAQSLRPRRVLASIVAMAFVLLGAAGTGNSAVVLDESDSVGGPLHAEIYPSGVATAPDGTVVVADTGNNRVVRYSPDGSVVWSVGTYGSGIGRFDNPRDVAVDDENVVYVADTRNSRIVKLASDGSWLASSSGPAPGFSFPLGVSAKADKVYVGDTGRARAVVMDRDLTTLRTVTGNGACSAMADNRDVQADADGNIYVAGYKSNQILKFSETGDCLRVWGGTGSRPGQFRTPYGVETAADPVTGQELVYVADGLNNRVQVFDSDGGFVTAFGNYGEPDQPGTFTTVRRVAVATDGTGDVWAADLWGDRIERWRRTAGGFTYDRTIGAVLPDPTPAAVFHEPRGMAYTPSGDLWVTDTVHHQFVRFGADGSIEQVCGRRAAEGSQLGQFNWPRGIAVDPATGNLWIADTKQHQLQVLTEGCTGIGLVRKSNAGSDARSFNWPYDIAIRPSDRYAFVVDTQNHRIKAYDVAGASWPDAGGPSPAHVWGQRGTGATNFRWPSAVAVGPDGHIFVADRGNNRIQELTYSPATGFGFVKTWSAGGSLDQPEGVAVLADGRIVVADSADDEIVVIGGNGAIEGAIGGLHHPSAVEVSPDGRIVGADTYADIVRTWEVSTAQPDTVPPAGTITEPAPQARLTSPVTLAGTATDDRGVGSVRLGIRQIATGRWWNGTDWQATAIKVTAQLQARGQPETTWTYSMNPPAGAYGFSTDISDTAGNLATGAGKPSWRNFAVVP